MASGRTLVAILGLEGNSARTILDAWPRLEVAVGVAPVIGIRPRLVMQAAIVMLCAASAVLLLMAM